MSPSIALTHVRLRRLWFNLKVPLSRQETGVATSPLTVNPLHTGWGAKQTQRTQQLLTQRLNKLKLVNKKKKIKGNKCSHKAGAYRWIFQMFVCEAFNANNSKEWWWWMNIFFKTAIEWYFGFHSLLMSKSPNYGNNSREHKLISSFFFI